MTMIKGYENYSISESGAIMNIVSNRKVKEKNNKVNLYKDGKKKEYLISDLILENFDEITFKSFLNIPFEISFEIKTENKKRYCYLSDGSTIDMSTLKMVLKPVEIVVDEDKIELDKDTFLLDGYPELVIIRNKGIFIKKTGVILRKKGNYFRYFKDNIIYNFNIETLNNKYFD